MRYLWLPVLFIALVVAPAPSRADFAAGLKAYGAGDFKTAMKEWLPLAQAGDAEAQFRVGRLYGRGEGVVANGVMAEKWYRRAHEQGHLKATNNLALLYDEGKLIGQDYIRAFKLYQYAASRGATASQVNLGLMYIGGHGVQRNFVVGFTWLFRAEKNGAKNVEELVNSFAPYVPASDVDTARETVFGRKSGN